MSAQVTKAAGSLIYIVDDDDAVRDSLRLLLETYGMTVEDFGSTAEFSAAERQHPRACLILDLHLPVMGGLEYLASRPKDAARLPVIVVTGRSDEASKARALELGAVDFLEKPVDLLPLIRSGSTSGSCCRRSAVRSTSEASSSG